MTDHPVIAFVSFAAGSILACCIIVYGSQASDRRTKELIAECKQDGGQVMMKGKNFQGCLIKH
jgi:hypothetical protein